MCFAVRSTPTWIYGLDEVTGPVASPGLVLAEYDFGIDPPPGIEMELPNVDNGVHLQLMHHPPALDQIRQFIETGSIHNACDGPCDPD